ncbi:acetyl-coa carboxylase [Culex quinquefasciatus]|uniref:Acetyl-coa carboxylase n=1 Tax=Culex quinquefasciatus TaxID=7176 RepID=B0WUC1_CULQU|nr:acetyl-coa carboxylase [Culex quinquefasciatus]|eukprot:XP_001870926.1 acetyl-coa carboxylase [Culex quinquefasciatus]
MQVVWAAWDNVSENPKMHELLRLALQKRSDHDLLFLTTQGIVQLEQRHRNGIRGRMAAVHDLSVLRRVCNAMLDYVHWAYSSYDLTCLQHLELSGKVPLRRSKNNSSGVSNRRLAAFDSYEHFTQYSDEILDLLGDMTSRRAIRTAA